MSSITCENGPGSPSAFRSGGSKVIRRLLRGRREKPGDEAITSRPRGSVAGVRGCAVYPLGEFFV